MDEGSDMYSDINPARVELKGKRLIQDAQDIAWTAYRCHRLLKAIVSRINTLRKLAEPDRIHHPHPSLKGDAASLDPHRKKFLESQGDGSGVRQQITSPSNDRSWIPEARQRRPGKTYSSKARSLRTVNPPKIRNGLDRCGLSTPLVTHLLQFQGLRTSRSDNATSGRFTKKPKLERVIRSFPTKQASCAQRNLVLAFETLLTSTAEGKITSRTGACSLMSASLRSLPAHLEFEEERVTTSGPADADQSYTYGLYSELEALGTNPDGGWSGLRELVRSHGVCHVSAAIKDGTLDPATVEALVVICARTGAIAEGLALLEAWLGHGGTSKHALMKLLEFCHIHQAHAPLLRVVGRSIDAKKLSLLDICEHDQVWRSIVCATMESQDLWMVEALIGRLGGDTLDSEQPAKALKGLALMLTAVCVHGDRSISNGIVDEIHRVATNLLLHRAGADPLILCGKSPEVKHDCASSPWLMSALILCVLDLRPDGSLVYPSIESLMTAACNSSKPDRFDTGAVITERHDVYLIAEFGHVIRAVDPRSGHKTFERLVRTLIGISNDCSPATGKRFRNLILDNALAYAGHQEDNVSMELAEEIADLVAHGAPSIAANMRKSTAKSSSFRWEAGLCEWIAATPARAKIDRPLVGTQDTPALLRSPAQLHPYGSRGTEVELEARGNVRNGDDSPTRHRLPQTTLLNPTTQPQASRKLRANPDDAYEHLNGELPPCAEIQAEDDDDELALYASAEKRSRYSLVESGQSRGQRPRVSRKIKPYLCGSAPKTVQRGPPWSSAEASDDELGL